MEDIFAIVGIFVAFPIILFHYITKWKTAKTLTGSDEKLLDDRMATIERIMSAENPNWRHQLPSRDQELGLDRERLLSREDR